MNEALNHLKNGDKRKSKEDTTSVNHQIQKKIEIKDLGLDALDNKTVERYHIVKTPRRGSIVPNY